MKVTNKRAFTLIELLVVVLIIGILAAVALPQYQKAVKRSRGTEVLTVVEALEKAMHAYYLEHGTFDGVTADTLGIELPELKHFKYCKDTAYAPGTSTFEMLGGGWNHNYGLEIYSPENVTLTLDFNNDGTISKTCSTKATSNKSYTKCSDYFNLACQETSAQYGSDPTVYYREMCSF